MSCVTSVVLFIIAIYMFLINKIDKIIYFKAMINRAIAISLVNYSIINYITFIQSSNSRGIFSIDINPIV